MTSVPIMRQGGRDGIIGYTNELPGGFGEYMLLDEDFLLEVPAGLDDDLAALIEPLAVGLEHARAGEPQPGEIPLVVGCGAIGLGVIAGLKLKGIGPIVAADFDAEAAATSRSRWAPRWRSILASCRPTSRFHRSGCASRTSSTNASASPAC